MEDNPPTAVLTRGAFADLAELEARVASFGESFTDVAPAAALELLDRFEVLHRKINFLRAQLMTRVHDGGLWAVDGARSFPSWAAARLGNNPKAVSKTVRETTSLRNELPALEQAVRKGEVAWDRVSTVTRYALGTQAQKDALQHPEVGEEFLVQQAKVLPVDKFRYLVRTWADRADPTAGDARWQKDASQEYLVFAKTIDGYHLQGWLSEFNGQVIAEALNAAIGVTDAGDERSLQQRNAQALVDIAQNVLDAGSFLPSATVRPHLSVTVDYETLQELLAEKSGRIENHAPFGGLGAAQALPNLEHREAELLHIETPNLEPVNLERPGRGRPGTERPGTERPGIERPGIERPGRKRSETDPPDRKRPGVRPPDRKRPKVGVANRKNSQTRPPDLGGGEHFAVERQPTFDDGAVLTARQLEFLSCDSSVTRIVFGPRSEVLDVGRAKRTVTAAQRKAVHARDRHCQFPGCGASSFTMEVHHVKHWVNGGETSVDNSILLCRYHHQHVHQRAIEIRWQSGTWIFRDEYGAVIRNLNRLTPVG